MLTGVVYFILFLDWLAMLAAHIIVRWFSPLLLLLGVVRGHPGGARLTTHAWRYGRSDSARRIYSPGKLTLGCDIPAPSA
jgi:hypothetical protein